jgi:hypothetical protein
LVTARGSEGPPSGVAERPGDDDRLDETGRISQGLADVLVHRLFAVGLDLHAALTYIEADIADDMTIEKIHKAIGGLDGAIRDFRAVVFDLHPEGLMAQAGLRTLIVEAVERACAPGGGRPVLTLGQGMEAVIDQPAWQQVARLVHRTLTLVPGERLCDTHVVVTADPRPPTRLVMHIDGPVRDLAGVAGRLRAVDEHTPREDDRHWREMDFSCQDVPRYPERSRIRLEWCMAPQ